MPGVIISIRLFWADEFAVIHSRGVLSAVRESWALTKGHTWRIFRFHMRVAMAEMLVSLGGLIALVLTFFLMFMVSQPVLTSGVGLVTLLTVVFLFVLVVPHGAELVGIGHRSKWEGMG